MASTEPTESTVSPSNYMLSTEQFTALVQTIADKGTGATATTTPTPRIGGVSPVGAWTGRGAQGLGQQP